MDKELFGLLSIVLHVLGYGVYFWRVLRRETKPHVFSWLIWGLITGITFFAQINDNAGPGAWPTGFNAATCLLVAIVAVWFGEKDIKRSDVIALIGAFVAMALWRLTGSPVGSVILVSLIDALGFYPTFRKSYAKPWEESVFLYSVDVLRWIMGFLALENVSLVTALNPLTVMLTDFGFVVMVLVRRRLVATQQKTV